jgi:transcriptional regulator with XRE-family HTH domain
MSTSFGARIRQLREEKDISLREFAKRLGEISAAHVSDIELGRRFPSPALLQKMASVLRVPLGELEQYDSRAPVDEIKRRAASDPAFGFALRKLVDRNLSAEEIIRLLDDSAEGEHGK